ncbi:MAG: SurA N-terminal domain-containing protein [Candidatus Omnitrophica bacterium]|nr:SurA N-terminal domain-containing protein [Candidatus Omnitrophota bacterium]
MLKFYRKNIKVIIWVIVLSFIIWGIGTLSLSKESASAAMGMVGKEKISHKEFLTTFRYYDLLTHLETKEKDPNSKPMAFEALKSLTWQVIALSRVAKQEGVSVSDNEVREEIEKQFSQDGQFNELLYEHWIQNIFQGRPRDFEEAIRKHLVVRKLREKVLKDVPHENQEDHWVAWLGSTLNRIRIVDYSRESSKETTSSAHTSP